MNIKIILLTIQAIVSVLLIITILFQQIGSGLSGTFGGSGTSYHTKRGVEKILFNATVFLATIFISLSIANLLLTS